MPPPGRRLTRSVAGAARLPRARGCKWRPKTAHFWQQKHWLTIEYEGGYAYMQLDKNNQRQIRAALGVAGFEVETIIED